MAFEQCPSGTYNPSTGASDASACIGCAAGKANPIPGSTDASVCLDTLPGSYADSPGTATSLLCPAGSYQTAAGQTACLTCTAGYLCVEGTPATAPTHLLALRSDWSSVCSGPCAWTGASAPIPCPGGTHADQAVRTCKGSNLGLALL